MPDDAFGRPVAAFNLPASHYPMTFEFIRSDTGEVVEELRLEGPGALNVQPWAEKLGGVRIRVRVTNGLGEVHTEE